MTYKEKVIKGLECCTNIEEVCISDCPYFKEFPMGDGRCITALQADALAPLKEQEESIPVSWLKEKLEGHPELPYAVTDGINNVLDLRKGR